MISIDEFKKAEIRVGEILSAEAIPDADKLLLLKVSFGTEERQIVSGIRGYFENPSELVGMQVAFVTNLEPRVIRGYESQGMILAASSEEEFALLVPHKPVTPGSGVR
jgi:methionine--tRNA ligase beta chain